MSWKEEWRKLVLMLAVFAACFYLPVGAIRFDHAVLEAFHLVKWYAREHVLLCLVPAFFIAGAIGQFVSQGAVLRYLGAAAPRPVAYGVASVSGSVLAVCSCAVLPLFAGIHRRGAGLGPATAFLYSGPAIDVLAIILTAQVLGPELGLARASWACPLLSRAVHFMPSQRFPSLVWMKRPLRRSCWKRNEWRWCRGQLLAQAARVLCAPRMPRPTKNSKRRCAG